MFRPARRHVPTATRSIAAALVLLASVSVAAPTAGLEPIDDNVPLPEVAAYLQARAAFDRNCFRCHKSTGEEASRKGLERLDMSRYPFGGKKGPVAGIAIRKALGGGGGAGGGKATMPKDDPDSLGAEDLAILLRWTDAFDAARKDRPSSALINSRPW